MVKIFPFRGVRSNPYKAIEIASPPYDVLSVSEAKDIVSVYPNSFLRINKAECDFNQDIDPHDIKVYEKAKNNLYSYINHGLLVQDKSKCFYIYRLTYKGKSQTGLCCLLSIDDYEKGIIKKHEHTRPEKVKDRANHIEYLEAQVGPVFSIFKNNQGIKNSFDKIVVNNPETKFKSEDGVMHELWVVNNLNLIKEIQKRFEKLNYVYIADGHHRSESAAEVRLRKKNVSKKIPNSYNYFLQVLFPDNEVNILAYNRIAKIPPHTNIKKILIKAKSYFNISKNASGAFTPDAPGRFALYCDNAWYKMKIKNGLINRKDAVESIDAEILQKYFIGPFLKIENPKTDNRIDFVGGIRGNSELEKRVNLGEYDVAFSLFSTSVEQLLSVANEDKVMPPKSTWFEPKLRSGMIVNMLNN